MFTLTENDISRFLDKVVFADTGCWLWTGSQNSSKRPMFQLNRRSEKAHRIMAYLTKPGFKCPLHVLHHCDVPMCVNPEHLFLGTHQDNIKDREAKGRRKAPKGELSSCAKLTEKDVIEIRTARKEGRLTKADMPAWASRFGISIYGLHAVIFNATWKHVRV